MLNAEFALFSMLLAITSGVIWQWQDFRGGDDSVVTPENPDDHTLTYLPDGKLAIKADCNRATGTYTAEAVTFDLTVGGTTRAIDPPVATPVTG